MWAYPSIKGLLILTPIIGLLLVGLIITLRSGVVDARSNEGAQRLAANFSQMLLRVVGYGIGLLAMQQFIGFRMSLGW